MFQKHLIAGLTLGFAVAWAAPAWAIETVNRKRDKPLSGEVSGVSKTEVTIKVKTPKEDTIKVPANEIQSIAWTGDTPDAGVARSDENAGRYQKAIEGYQKAMQSSKATNAFAKADLEFGIARASAKLALGEPSKIDDAVGKLEDFRKKQSDNYRFYEAVSYLGQLYAAKNELIKAKLAFDVLAKAPWKESQMAARIASGRLLLKENKLDEAAAEYEAVVGTKPEGPVEESQWQEAVLGKSRILIAQKKYEDGLKLLEEVIKNAAADDSKVNAEAFLRKGDCLREKGDDKDALLAYLHVDVLFASEKPQHAEALFRLAQLWDRVGNKARGDEARDRLRSDYDYTEWAKQLKEPATGG
jgi:tetratricopeptide (TPR) repeat protein